MNKLDIGKINDHAPYDVFYDGDAIIFHTDHDVDYSVTFDDDGNPYFTAYWFNLSNMNGGTSPGDKKIAQTVICIIEEFFRENPEILLYLCSTDDNQQAQRARLFLRWFNGAQQQSLYAIRTAELNSENGKEYVALIVQRSNPHVEEILQFFENDVAMFNEMKP